MYVLLKYETADLFQYPGPVQVELCNIKLLNPFLVKIWFNLIEVLLVMNHVTDPIKYLGVCTVLINGQVTGHGVRHREGFRSTTDVMWSSNMGKRENLTLNC